MLFFDFKSEKIATTSRQAKNRTCCSNFPGKKSNFSTKLPSPKIDFFRGICLNNQIEVNTDWFRKSFDLTFFFEIKKKSKSEAYLQDISKYDFCYFL